jgi:Uma2 family endonuclease
VEVVSEHDRYTELQKKIAHYRAVGVRLVWIVEHETRTITVYTGERALVLQGNDALDGGDILPGFSLSLTDIFEIA